MKIFIFILILYVTIGCKQRHSTISDVTSSDVFTLADLKKSAAKNIPQLIEQLPEGYRVNYVLMNHSESPQKASKEHPRLIMFNRKKSQFSVVAVSSDPSDPLYNTVEMIEYDSRNKSYNFQTAKFNNESKTLSDINPPFCSDCHESPMRPNWDPYPRWPGAVGEKDRLSNEDKRYLKKYSKEQSNHAIFSQLDAKKQFREYWNTAVNEITTAAFRLDTLLGYSQSEVTAHELDKAAKGKGVHKDIVLSALYGCENIFPNALNESQAKEWGNLRSLAKERLAKTNKSYIGIVALNGNRQLNISANLHFILGRETIDLAWLSTGISTPFLIDVAGETYKQVVKNYCKIQYPNDSLCYLGPSVKKCANLQKPFVSSLLGNY